MAVASTSAQAQTQLRAELKKTINFEGFCEFCVTPNGDEIYLFDDNKKCFTRISNATGDKKELKTQSCKATEAFWAYDIECIITNSETNIVILIQEKSGQYRRFIITYKIVGDQAVIEQEEQRQFGSLSPGDSLNYGQFLSGKEGLKAVIYWRSVIGTTDKTCYSLFKVGEGNPLLDEQVFDGRWALPFLSQETIVWSEFPDRKNLMRCQLRTGTGMSMDTSAIADVKNLRRSRSTVDKDVRAYYCMFDSTKKASVLVHCDWMSATWRPVDMDLGVHNLDLYWTSLKSSEGTGSIYLYGECTNGTCKGKDVWHIFVFQITGDDEEAPVQTAPLAIAELERQNETGRSDEQAERLRSQIEKARKDGFKEEHIKEAFGKGPYADDTEATKALVAACMRQLQQSSKESTGDDERAERLRSQIEKAREHGFEEEDIKAAFGKGQPYATGSEATKALVEACTRRLQQPSIESLRSRQQAQAAQRTDGILKDLVVETIDEDSRCLLDLEPSFQEVYRPSRQEPRGIAMIINNRYFTGTHLPERVGTDIDAANLQHLFQQLGYKIKLKQNLSATQMMHVMVRFTLRPEHATADSAVVAVLTHGCHGQLYGTDGEKVPIDKFTDTMNQTNCPALKWKPKVFILQACRGDNIDEGDGVHIGTFTDEDVLDTSLPGTSAGASGSAFPDKVDRLTTLLHEFVHLDRCDARNMGKLPIGADFLKAYATTPGFISWRREETGSWFIQTICKIFAKHAKDDDITQLMTRVQKEVAEKFETDLVETDYGAVRKQFLQMPQYESQLLKRFYLFPGYTKKFYFPHLWKDDDTP